MADNFDISNAPRQFDRLVFQRKGRDIEDFAGIAGPTGRVTIRGEQVIVEMRREAVKANKELKKVAKSAKSAGAALDKTAKRANATKKLNDRSSGRRKGFFRFNGESIIAGPINIGKSGITASQTFLRNNLGTAFTASIGAHIIGGAAGKAADLRDEYKLLEEKGASRSEKVRYAALEGTRLAANTLLTYSGIKGVASGFGRLMGAYGSDQEFDAAWNRVSARLFDTEEELKRKRATKQEMVDAAKAQVHEHFATIWERINNYQPRRIMMRGRAEMTQYKRENRWLNEFTLKERERLHRNIAGAKASRAAFEAGIP